VDLDTDPHGGADAQDLIDDAAGRRPEVAVVINAPIEMILVAGRPRPIRPRFSLRVFGHPGVAVGVEDELAEAILQQQFKEGDSVCVDVEDGKIKMVGNGAAAEYEENK